MTDMVRWGILGTGKIARAMATALREVPGATLAAVASRSIDGAQAFGAEFGALACYGSYQELADAPDIDIIYIGTPHPMHAQNALMALHAGKAVLCEKPFTMNRREAELVVELARAKKLFLMEAMWTRFMPALAEVKRIIASGEIGQVHQLNADFGFMSTLGPEHRLHNPALGGGALLDIGIYPLSIAADLLGPVASVQASADMGDTGVDAQTAFILKHRDGAMSSCLCSTRARSPIELTVSGEQGHVRMNTPFYKTQSLTVTLADGSARTVSTPLIGNGYGYEAIEAMRCMRAGLIESPGMTHADTLALMGVLDTIRTQIGLRYPTD